MRIPTGLYQTPKVPAFSSALPPNIGKFTPASRCLGTYKA